MADSQAPVATCLLRPQPKGLMTPPRPLHLAWKPSKWKNAFTTPKFWRGPGRLAASLTGILGSTFPTLAVAPYLQ